MTLREWVLLLVLGFLCMGTAKAGSVPPITEQQASDLMMDIARDVTELAASSEGLLRQQLVREKECGARLLDERTIQDFSEAGYNQRALVTFVLEAPDVKDDKLPQLLQRILDAFKYEGGPKAWFSDAWKACVDGA